MSFFRRRGGGHTCHHRTRSDTSSFRTTTSGVAVLATLAALALPVTASLAQGGPDPASAHTREILSQHRAALPFSDARDFQESDRGFIAKPAYREIRDDQGNVVWDLERYQFLAQSSSQDSIHPSLLRQARLNSRYGLYQVSSRIYQVRGFDLSNISLVLGDSGWIVIDPLLSEETARAAMDLVHQELGRKPVRAVIYSHSHADHFGGVRGVVDEADVNSGTVQIIAPAGFMEHAIAENVYAGTAMNRRADYQYGVNLSASPRGHVDQAIGKGISRGTIGLIAPTRTIADDFEELVIDGVRMVFQNTPGTEAPAEMNTWFPDFKVFWAAENITGTIHNIYTLRGALVRDALTWSRYINEALYRFGNQAEIMFSSHNWPRWGNARIQEVMRGQRDMYAHLNNYTLHLANQGVTINQIHNVYRVPESQRNNWFSRGYHGSFEHNVRGVLNRYLGYWDGNPATLIPLSPDQSAPLFVEMMGGPKPILTKANELFLAGQYRHAEALLNTLVQAQPGHRAGTELLARTFDQLGYQQESPSVRNSYLAAAQELRAGGPVQAGVSTLGPDLVKAMSTGRFLDLLGIQLDASKAEGLAFTINLATPDNRERYVLELSHGALTNIADQRRPDADLSIAIDRSDLEQFIMGRTSFQQLVDTGKAALEGDPAVFKTLQSLLVRFDPRFPIMPSNSR